MRVRINPKPGGSLIPEVRWVARVRVTVEVRWVARVRVTVEVRVK